MATIGLDSLYYAKITEASSASAGVEIGDEIYGTPIKLAKAIDADLAVELLEAVLYADDGADTTIKEFKSGTLTLGINDIGVQAAEDLTGAVLDGNGVLISSGEDEPAPVAIGFRAKTANGHYRYFWLYRVKFGIPSASLKTKGDSIEFSTPSIEGTISRRNKKDSRGKHPWKAEVTEGQQGVSGSVVADWFTSVYEPNYAFPDTTLSALTIGSVALSPTFAPGTHTYTATTSNTTNTITATATATGAAVAITVNGTSIASGDSVTWETGANTVVVTVTNSGSTGTYTVTVTKGA